MKQIKLTELEIENFKGISNLKVQFGDITRISGGNATGKSTIYEAYLWVLFGKNANGNVMNVLPMDKNNEIKHDLTASVKAAFLIDGMPFEARKETKEIWSKPRGCTEPRLSGTETNYYINSVPVKKAEYDEKLGEFFNLEHWMELSSISIIPNMAQDERRRLLTSLVGGFDENAILAKYPLIQAAFEKGMDIRSLIISTRDTKAKAKADLDAIPSMITAQEALRKDDDWDSIKNQMQENTNKRNEVHNRILELKGMVDTGIAQKIAAKQKELQDTISLATGIYSKHNAEWREKRKKAEEEISMFETKLRTLSSDNELDKSRVNGCDTAIEAYQKEISKLREAWTAENAKTFVQEPVGETCPTCGQRLPADQIANAIKEQEALWNLEHTRRLDEYVQKANATKQYIKEQESRKATIEKQMEDRVKEIEAKENQLSATKAAYNTIPDVETMVKNDKTYQDLLQKRDRLMAELEKQSIEATDVDNNQLIRQAVDEEQRLATEYSELRARYDGFYYNERIDAEQAKLRERETQLAQSVADCEKIEKEIASYKKERILMVEQAVSSHFSIVRWKLYEQNVTNDGEKEICQAVIDGVPYEQTNRAMQFNAAIDIINGISSCLDVKLPLFIDNKESVETLIETQNQVITLTVVPGSPLGVTSCHK